MTDYTELVKALRYCSTTKGMVYCNVNCKYGWEERSEGCKDLLMTDAAAAIEALQAEVKRLEPKRGEWLEDTKTYAGPGLSNYKCSLCGKICGTWRRGLEPSELPNWCGNCGADMRAKMEVQE